MLKKQHFRMNEEEKAPTLSFQCPKLLTDMPGSEKECFCDTCGHSVRNLSLMSNSERKEVWEQAKHERVCGIYFEDLYGNLVTAETEAQLIDKMKTLRLAALASGALALSA